ncbi:MAG: NAD-dependent dihydropyrimidine dehydrogenase subunit PreA [Phycisphaerales bacterium]|nr:NAD-dependent dihydropyrimidine dehydrogenase subunit PreA [Phycisphaerales bacterium]
MPDLSVCINGMRFPNPFVIASGPPGTNANVIGRAYDEGWGGVVCKTVCLDAESIINVSPRYAHLRAADSDEIMGWENIELISDRPFETWLDEFRRIKDLYPQRPLIASVMEECARDRWVEIIQRCDEMGVDGFELNLSCPHGLPERHMGQAMGQDPEIVREVCQWARSATRKPIWAKMTPNITSIVEPARAALEAGCDGITAINTILCVMGVDLETLRPLPTVEGYSEAGGYSSKAIRPIALRMVMETARLVAADFPAATVSAAGGVESGDDAVQFILLGAGTVQVCTGVMKFGYRMIRPMLDDLRAFMDQHGFETVDEFRGRSLPYFTTHADLVSRQAAARAARGGEGQPAETGGRDDRWQADRLVEQSRALSSQEPDPALTRGPSQ